MYSFFMPFKIVIIIACIFSTLMQLFTQAFQLHLYEQFNVVFEPFEHNWFRFHFLGEF